MLTKLFRQPLSSVESSRTTAVPRALTATNQIEVESTANCVICGAKARTIGRPVLDGQKVEKYASSVIGRWYPVARDQYGYASQELHLCTGCGLFFVTPVLTDSETIDLIFSAHGATRPKVGGWRVPEAGKAPHVFSRAVRVPSFDESLKPFLRGAVRLLDVGAHGGDLTLHLALPAGSQVDLLQIENSFAFCDEARLRERQARQFTGLLSDLVEHEPKYQADIVFATHVLEHTADPLGFIREIKHVMSPEGIALIEVPYEPHEVVALARNSAFSLAHHLWLMPWSFKNLLWRGGLRVEQFELLNHAHTGIGSTPYTVLRAVCSHAPEGALPPPPAAAMPWSLDVITDGFAGSITHLTDASFVVFQFDPNVSQLASVFEGLPNFRGILTSNQDLISEGMPNVFGADFSNIEYIITLNSGDRAALRQNLPAAEKVI